MISPRLDWFQFLTSNINNSPSGFEDQAFIEYLNPKLFIGRQSSKLDLGLDMEIKAINYMYTDVPDRKDYQVIGSASTSLLNESLSIKGKFYVDQQLESIEQSIASDNVLSDGFDKVNGYFVEGRYDAYFKDKDKLFVSNARRLSTYKRNPNLNISGSDFNVGYISNFLYQRVNLELDFSSEQKRFENTRNYDNDIIGSFAALNYHFGDKFSLRGMYGYEDIKYLNNDLRYVNSRWELGTQWYMRRLRIALSYGRRFFGKTYSGLLGYKGNAIYMDVAYKEEVGDSFQNSLLDNIPSESGAPATPAQIFNATGSGTYVLKRWEERFKYKKDKYTLDISSYAYKHNYLLSDSTDWAYQVTIDANINITKRFDLGMMVRRHVARLLAENVKDTQHLSSVRAERKIRRNMTGRLEFSRLVRESTNSIRDYKEAIIMSYLRVDI